MYGCETWILDSSCLKVLESFQCEIGRRILRLPKFYSNNAIRIGLHWPTVSTRILLRKLSFLAKLLSSKNDSISTRVFNSLAIDDVYDSSIVQQCRMLESALGTDVLACCLLNPDSAVDSVKRNKHRILKQDFDLLISSSSSEQTSSYLVAHVAKYISWRRLWDLALDRGVKGTRTLQSVFKELSRPKSVFTCIICVSDKISESSCFEHVCDHHSDLIGELTCIDLLDCLTQANSVSFLNSCMCMSSCNSIWSIVF